MSLMELASSLSAGYVPSKCLISLNLSFGWQGQWWVTTLQSYYAVSMSWWLWKIKKNYNVGEKEEATNGAWGWLTLFAEFPLATRGQSYRMETLNCHLIRVYGEYQWVWQKVNACGKRPMPETSITINLGSLDRVRSGCPVRSQFLHLGYIRKRNQYHRWKKSVEASWKQGSWPGQEA